MDLFEIEAAMPKILVSMIAYRERYLEKSIKDCLEKADNPENIYFSVVSEQSESHLHPDLSFVDQDRLIYRKYDLSEYRGIMWSRNKTTEVDFDYDYVLFTCGHNMFAPNWDKISIEEQQKASLLNEKAIITSSGPEFEYNPDGKIVLDPRSGRTRNKYRPSIPNDYVPGYGFPNSLQQDVPETSEVLQDAYMQWSWVFAPKSYVIDASIDPEMGYHGEEIYLTVIAWSRGWRFFATPQILYYHDTYKEYPGETRSRMETHRPWIDINQKSFWEHSDRSMRRLNKLLSGQLYGDVTKEKVLKFCEETGLNSRYCEPFDDYSDIGLLRHAEDLRNQAPYLNNN